MKMKKLIIVLLTFVLLVGVVACGDTKETKDEQNDVSENQVDEVGEPSNDGQYEIAFIVKSLANQFFTDSQIGAEKRAKELGVGLTYLAPAGGEQDIEGQVQMVEDVIVKGVDLIILDSSDNVALNQSIAKATEAGIPVVLYNDVVDYDDLEKMGGKIESLVGLDSYEAAKMVGEFAAENSEPGKVALIEGISGVKAHQDRIDGFRDGLTDDFEVIASQPANMDMNEAHGVVQNILTANPEVSVIFCANGVMGQGAIQAIADLGKTGEVDVYDFDCIEEAIDSIKEGTLQATLRYPTLEWAELAMNTAYDVLQGKEVPEEVYTEVQVIHKDNVDKIE